MRTLLIDNYDSFTFNLFHLLGEVGGDEPIVVRNDELTWEELAALPVDNIVISPGLGRPERERDVGVSLTALRPGAARRPARARGGARRRRGRPRRCRRSSAGGSFTSLLWWEAETMWAVPDDAPILPGVTRALLIELARGRGTPVAQRRPAPHELADRETWLVSALHGIRAVTRRADGGPPAGDAPRAATWQRLLDGVAAPAV